MSSMSSDEEDESLAQFLESEVLLSHLSDQEEGTEMHKAKRQRLEENYKNDKCSTSALRENNDITGSLKDNEKSKKIITIGVKSNRPKRIDSGNFSKIPPELFPHILKFLSSEDLISCSMVCKFLNYAASDEYLWHRLYCMRWGLLPSPKKLRSSAWKKLYIQRDEEDMSEFARSCPPEFKEYFIQMQVAKRSHAPLPSQVNDDRLILDKTVADQVSMWKNSKGLTDKVVTDHDCSGKTCSMYQIGDVFICENSGNVHVCDDNCRELDMDPTNELFVCTISGRCFDRLLLPDEMEPDTEQQEGTTDEAEPFMGSGRIARAYLLGYNCADEKELEAALKYC